MLQLYSVILSLIFIGNTLFSNATKDIPLDIKPTHIPSVPAKDVTKEDVEQQNTLSDEEIAELELVFKYSPKRAQVIVNHLKDSNYFPHNRDYRSAYFVGEPGSGKTTMARAIAYEMSKEGWDCKFIASSDLLGEYRNRTAIRLKKELEDAVASKKPIIVVIDEANRLLENTESKHHDTDTAATAFWLFLDKQRNNEKFFLIGTMNRVTKLPKPFKDRILIDIIKFPAIDDAKIKNVIFREAITSNDMKFDNEVTDEFLDAELKKLGSGMGRMLHKVSKLVFQIQRMDNDEPVVSNVIKKEIITKAIEQYRELQNETDYEYVEETDEERQNRHHIENMNLQKQHHKSTQEMQEKHFVQQQLIQAKMIKYQHYVQGYGDRHYQTLQSKREINEAFSDEQNAAYDAGMANTKARKEREAEEAVGQEEKRKKEEAEKAPLVEGEQVKNSFYTKAKSMVASWF